MIETYFSHHFKASILLYHIMPHLVLGGHILALMSCLDQGRDSSVKPVLHCALGQHENNQEILSLGCVGVILYIKLCVGVALAMYPKCKYNTKCYIGDHPDARQTESNTKQTQNRFRYRQVGITKKCCVVSNSPTQNK